MTRRTRMFWAAVVIVVLASACSSTTQRDELAGEGPSGALAAALDEGTSDGTKAAKEEGVSSSVPAASAGTQGSGPAAPGAPSAPGAPLTPRQVPFGRGVTETTIKLGFFYQAGADPNTVCAGIGGCGGDEIQGADDPKAVAKTVIDYMNTHGGIAGRKIEPVWYGTHVENRLTKSGKEQESQQACTTFTQDNEVFAIVGGGFTEEDVLPQCTTKVGTAIIEPSGPCTNWMSEADFARYPHYYHLRNPSTERAERMTLKTLLRQKFFAKGARVGILTEDHPSIRAGVNNALKPALKAAGINVVSEAAYPDYIAAPWHNYVLQFQSAQVDHVIFSSSTCVAWSSLLFMREAENQLYRPKYGLQAMTGLFLQQNGPKAQYSKVWGPVWHLTYKSAGETGWNGQPYPAYSEEVKICRELMKKIGVSEYADGGHCDGLFFLKRTLDAASALTPEGLREATGKLGESFKSGATVNGATKFVPGRRDGAALVRDYRWVEERNRFDYVSGPYAID